MTRSLKEIVSPERRDAAESLRARRGVALGLGAAGLWAARSLLRSRP